MRASLVARGACILLSTAPCAAQYLTEVLVRAPGAQASGITPLTSINESGALGITTTAGVLRGLLATSPGIVRIVTFDGVNRAFNGVAINDATPLAFVTREAVLPLPPNPMSYFIRRWNDNGTVPWSAALLGSSLTAGGLPPDFSSATDAVDVNDLGETCFVGTVGGQTTLFRASTRPPTAVVTSGANLRPQIANSGAIVVRDDQGVVVFDALQPTRVADYAGGFASLGAEPGISKDGEFVAFIGDRGRGSGVFVCYREATGQPFSPPMRVIGDNNIASFPVGELGCDPATGEPIYLDSFDSTQRVGIVHKENGPGWFDNEIVVTYAATPNRASAPGASQNYTFRAAPGVWTTRALIENPPIMGGSPTASNIRLMTERTRVVSQVGETFGSDVIDSIRIYDPLASRAVSAGAPPAERPDTHWIGFRASAGAATLAIRARPGSATDAVNFAKYKQGDAPHGSLMLNPAASTPKLVSKIGCVLTSLTGVVNVLAAPGGPPITPSDVHRRVLRRPDFLMAAVDSNLINVPSFNYRLPDGRLVKTRDSGHGWQRLVGALSLCGQHAVMIAVPSMAQTAASTASGSKHYVLAYGLNPNRDQSAPVRAADIYIADPGFAEDDYDDAASAGYVPFRDAGERLVHVPLVRYFQAVNRRGGIAYEPENIEARIEEWFDAGAFYVGSTRYTIPQSHLPHLVRRFVITPSLRDGGTAAADSSLSVTGPVQIVARDPLTGAVWVSDPSLLTIPSSVLLERQGMDTPASVDEDDPPLDPAFPPYVLVLPPDASDRPLDLEIRGEATGAFEVRLHTGSETLWASPSLAGHAAAGSVSVGSFSVNPPCPPDANGDRFIDFLDLNIVLSDYGLVSAGLGGDLDNDGDCDFVDLNIVLSSYGNAC